MRASVPANLLLLGEYAVLEEGGLGLAVAAEPRVRVRFERRPRAGLAGAARRGSGARGGRRGWALRARPEGAPPAPAAVLEAALAAHRRAQGGRGSGYDVLASFHGGAGLFAGGGRPPRQAL